MCGTLPLDSRRHYTTCSVRTADSCLCSPPGASSPQAMCPVSGSVPQIGRCCQCCCYFVCLSLAWETSIVLGSSSCLAQPDCRPPRRHCPGATLGSTPFLYPEVLEVKLSTKEYPRASSSIACTICPQKFLNSNRRVLA